MAVTHKLCYLLLCFSVHEYTKYFIRQLFWSSIASGYYTTLLLCHVENWINEFNVRSGAMTEKFNEKCVSIVRNGRTKHNSARPLRFNFIECVREWFIYFICHICIGFFSSFFSFNIVFCCCNSFANNQNFPRELFSCSFLYRVSYIRWIDACALPLFLHFIRSHLFMCRHMNIFRSSVRFTVVSSVVLCRLFPLCSRYRLEID